jgi:hypothetical protein
VNRNITSKILPKSVCIPTLSHKIEFLTDTSRKLVHDSGRLVPAKFGKTALHKGGEFIKDANIRVDDGFDPRTLDFDGYLLTIASPSPIDLGKRTGGYGLTTHPFK